MSNAETRMKKILPFAHIESVLGKTSVKSVMIRGYFASCLGDNVTILTEDAAKLCREIGIIDYKRTVSLYELSDERFSRVGSVRIIQKGFGAFPEAMESAILNYSATAVPNKFKTPTAHNKTYIINYIITIHEGCGTKEVREMMMEEVKRKHGILPKPRYSDIGYHAVI